MIYIFSEMFKQFSELEDSDKTFLSHKSIGPSPSCTLATKESQECSAVFHI